MSYIVESDVLDIVVVRFVTERKAALVTDPIANYLALANEEIENLALQKGVSVSDIAKPIHSDLKQYAINYLVMLFCLDRVGVNRNNLAEMDTYQIKLKNAKDMINLYKSKITWQSIAGQNYTKFQNIGTGWLLR